MSVKLFITIDTEEDNWGDFRPTGHTVENVARIPIIQDLFERYGAVPTYLLNYPVVKNERAAGILRDILDKDRCEIGAHCHPWSTPPFEEETNVSNIMLNNLPLKVQRDKIGTLHEAIIDNFRIVPICFRAGRWNLGPMVARCIHELGYKIDSSVIPYSNWYLWGPDFWESSPFPYRIDPTNVLAKLWSGSLVEVPPTIGFLQENMNLCSRIFKWIMRSHLSRLHLVGILDRLRIINRRWLSPERSNGHDMILLSKNLIQQGYRYLNITFHSPTLLPGKTPYVRNDRQFRSFLHNIEIFLQFAQDQNMSFVPLRDALDVVNGTG